MQQITSVQNDLVKEVHSLQQKKRRNELGLFLIEGYKSVIEALKSNLDIKNIFISEDFKKMIEEKKQVEVVLWDERLSTKTALRAMIKGSERRDTQKSKKDELAAVVILQNYLDYKGASLC